VRDDQVQVQRDTQQFLRSQGIQVARAKRHLSQRLLT
jgi:hypothetical protein